MKYNPHYHHRRSIRLPEYDYAQCGIYFVTLCTYRKQCLFGEIHKGQISLNHIGKIVQEEWLKSSHIRQEIELDEWIIMPNHLHGIVVIINHETRDMVDRWANNNKVVDDKNKDASLAPLQGNVVGGSRQRKPRSLSSFIGGFKSSVTKRIKEFCQQPNPVIWQRNYYESILRNEQQLNHIRQYIINNPQKWDEDTEKPENPSQELLIDFLF